MVFIHPMHVHIVTLKTNFGPMFPWDPTCFRTRQILLHPCTH